MSKMEKPKLIVKTKDGYELHYEEKVVFTDKNLNIIHTSPIFPVFFKEDGTVDEERTFKIPMVTK